MAARRFWTVYGVMTLDEIYDAMWAANEAENFSERDELARIFDECFDTPTE